MKSAIPADAVETQAFAAETQVAGIVFSYVLWPLLYDPKRLQVSWMKDIVDDAVIGVIHMERAVACMRQA